MRQWIPLVCLVSLVCYIGWVLDQTQSQVKAASPGGIGSLEKALVQVGGTLEEVSFLLVAPIADPALPGRVRERLSWEGAPPRGEYREARLYTDKGMYYLALAWRMTGEQTANWVENHVALSGVLAKEGITTPVHVQLRGQTQRPASNLLTLVESALDSLAAEGRQPWAGDRSASVAGRSSQLPQGPHEVNVQAAARRTEQGVRLWVAWPALTGDY